MQLETSLDLISEALDINLFNVVKANGSKLSEHPFYSDQIYGTTFGAQDADVSDLVKQIQKNGFGEHSRVIELFGGEAFESMLLSKELPKNSYYSIDIAEYFVKHPMVNYIKGSVYGQEFYQPFDVLFASSTNASMCSITELNNLRKTAEFCRTNSHKGSIVVASFFQDTFAETIDFKCDYDVRQLKWNENYKNLYCHWFTVTKRDPYTGLHYYNVISILTKTPKLNYDVEHIFVSKHDKEAYFRSWDISIVAELFRENGFRFVKDTEIDTKSVVFIKE